MEVQPGEDQAKEKEIEDLKKRLEEKEREAKENYDRFLRAAADLDNYKKRAARRKKIILNLLTRS